MVFRAITSPNLTLNNWNFVLNHGWLFTDFEQVEKLVVILLTPTKSKT